MTEIVPPYVPAVKPTRFTIAVNDPVFVPDEGLNVSHGNASVAVQVSVPPPLLPMFTACADGLLPPTVPEKPRLMGLTFSMGLVEADEAVTVRVTGRRVGFNELSTLIDTLDEYVPGARFPVFTEAVN